MPLDNEDRCGIYPLATSRDDWMSPVCRWHDQRFIQNYSFWETTAWFAKYSFNRARMLDKGLLKPALYVAVGTVVGAPIWFGRKVFRALWAK